jgi:hypothetical protein
LAGSGGTMTRKAKLGYRRVCSRKICESLFGARAWCYQKGRLQYDDNEGRASMIGTGARQWYAQHFRPALCSVRHALSRHAQEAQERARVRLLSAVSRCRSRAIILHARNGAMPRICARQAARVVTFKVVAGQSDQLPFTSPCSCRRIQIIILYDSVQEVERPNDGHGKGNGYGTRLVLCAIISERMHAEVPARYLAAHPGVLPEPRPTSLQHPFLNFQPSLSPAR